MSDTQKHTKHAKRGEAGGPDESAARAPTSDASLLSKDKCSEGNDAQRATMPAALLSKDERCLIVILHACCAIVNVMLFFIQPFVM